MNQYFNYIASGGEGSPTKESGGPGGRDKEPAHSLAPKNFSGDGCKSGLSGSNLAPATGPAQAGDGANAGWKCRPACKERQTAKAAQLPL